jgi:hypothetical protein
MYSEGREYYDMKLLMKYEKMYDELAAKKVVFITNIWCGKFSNKFYKVDDFHPNENGAVMISEKIVSDLKKSHFFKSTPLPSTPPIRAIPRS